MEKLFCTTILTPIGFLKLTSDLISLVSVSFSDSLEDSSPLQPAILNESIQQLNEYFNGIRKEFNLNIKPAGTKFQQNVWELVKNIPFGITTSYLDIAIQTGSANNTRAVGLANGKNPIPIIIPCHRIIGSNGKLTGYAGGINNKRWLLQHELNHSILNGRLF